MPAKRTPTPEEMFGFGAVPLTSYFKAPEGGSANTDFSPQARAMLAQGEEYQRAQDALARQQQAQEAEDVANEMLGQTADMTDEEINQQMLSDPRLLNTAGGRQALQYQQFRQNVAPSKSDEVLGPILEAKIQDPRLLQKFRSRMWDEGMSANDAFDAFRRDEYNDKYTSSLAALGVPDTEFEKLKNPEGFIDPNLASRREAQAKADLEARKIGLKATPLDAEIKFLQDAIENRVKRFKDTEQDISKDQVYDALTKQLDKKSAEKLLFFNPLPKAKVSTLPEGEVAPPVAAAAPSVVAAPPVFDVTIPPEENQARIEQYNKGSKERAEKQKVADTIAKAWTDKKVELIDKMEPIYKTPDEMRAVANSILLGKTTNVRGKPEPYIEYLAQKLGIKLGDTAFEEPEAKSWNRLGSQKVTNAELLKAWAQSFLDADKKLQAASAQPSEQIVRDKGVKVTQIE